GAGQSRGEAAVELRLLPLPRRKLPRCPAARQAGPRRRREDHRQQRTDRDSAGHGAPDRDAIAGSGDQGLTPQNKEAYPMAWTFNRKTVWHAELVKASPLTVRFTSDVRNSKYKDKPPYIHFMVRGDSQEYQYQVENDDIREQLAGIPQNEWIELEARGSRGDADIQLTFTGEEAEDDRPQRQRSASRDRGDDNGRDRRASDSGRADTERESLAATMWRCLTVAHEVVSQFEGKHGPLDENTRTLALSLFIEHNRGNVAPLR